jgi:hypothetical protein
MEQDFDPKQEPTLELLQRNFDVSPAQVVETHGEHFNELFHPLADALADSILKMKDNSEPHRQMELHHFMKKINDRHESLIVLDMPLSRSSPPQHYR